MILMVQETYSIKRRELRRLLVSFGINEKKYSCALAQWKKCMGM